MTIALKGLTFFGYHGVFDEEKKNGQEFVIDFTMKIGETVEDDLKFTADYGAAAELAAAYATENRFDLIETLADGLANRLLEKFPALKSVGVTVHKPHAPLTVPFSDVSVSVCKKWETVYLGLGSNLGDRKAYIDGAVASLERRADVKALTLSNLVETVPYGVVDQGKFLNAALKLSTYLSPTALLRVTQSLEKDACRTKTRHWGERTLDVDILLYGNEIVSETDLIVPHIELAKRAFVLDPLREIAAGAVHPVLRKTIQTLWEEIHESHFALM